MDAISEARRHLANAKEILSEKAKKLDGHCQDKKYIKMAGHTAYTGVVLALNALLNDKKKTPGKASNDIRKNMDRKMTASFSDVYEILHLSIGYDGVQNAKVIAIGLQEAENLINWTEQRLQKVA